MVSYLLCLLFLFWALLCLRTIKPFLPFFLSCVTHVRKDTRPFPTSISVLQALEGWAGLGNEANCVYNSFVTIWWKRYLLFSVHMCVKFHSFHTDITVLYVFLILSAWFQVSCDCETRKRVEGTNLLTSHDIAVTFVHCVAEIWIQPLPNIGQLQFHLACAWEWPYLFLLLCNKTLALCM